MPDSKPFGRKRLKLPNRRRPKPTLRRSGFSGHLHRDGATKRGCLRPAFLTWPWVSRCTKLACTLAPHAFWLNNAPSSGCDRPFLSGVQGLDASVVSNVWALQLMLPGTPACKTVWTQAPSSRGQTLERGMDGLRDTWRLQFPPSFPECPSCLLDLLPWVRNSLRVGVTAAFPDD